MKLAENVKINNTLSKLGKTIPEQANEVSGWEEAVNLHVNGRQLRQGI